MRALRLHGAGVENLRFDEIETPHPGPRQLVGRVDAVMACASDSKIIDQGSSHPLMYGWDLGRHPVPIGHEGCITVAEVGDALAGRFAPGERFAIQPAVPSGPCNHRERYRNGAEGVEKIAIGYTLDGLFAEYVLITEEVIDTGCLLPLPEAGMPLFAAALAEPLSCVVSAQEHSVHILKDGPAEPRRAHLGMKPGGIVVVVGAGPMGRMHVEVALSYRPRTLVVSEPLPGRRNKLRGPVAERARSQGTSLVLTSPSDLEDVLATESGGRGADDIIVAVGSREMQEKSLGLLARYGVANFFGGLKTGDHTICLDTRRVHYDSVTAAGSSGGDPSDAAKAISLLAEGAIDAGSYVAAVGGLEAAKDLLGAVREQRLDGKGVIYPSVRVALRQVDRWDADRERLLLEGKAFD
jgi:threonine dehydrogenase-like Zn-dependent dehydrogenase